MPIFMPTAAARCATEITPEMLRALGAEAVLLDVDNTLTRHNHPDVDGKILCWLDRMKAGGVRMIVLSNNSISRVKPFAGVVEWTHKLQEAGFSVIIVSNNTRRRVQAFAAGFGLPFCSRALKPLPVGYVRAARLAGVPCRRCVVVGDQIFTDIVGANLVGMSSVLLTPLQEETGWSFKVRRRLEKPFRKKLSDQERGK